MRDGGASHLAWVTLLPLVIVGCASRTVLPGVVSIEEATRHDDGHAHASLPPPAVPPRVDLTKIAVPGDVARQRVALEGAPSRGAETPLVTMVLFSDFQCPFCARVRPTVEQVLAAHPNDVRLYFRHHPLPFHQNARPAAALAALAYELRGNEGFWRAHDLLFDNQRALERADLESYGRMLQLDPARVSLALDGAAQNAQVLADEELARTLGSLGTPTFYLNGRQLVGAQPLDAFETVVNDEIRIANQGIALGVPRSEVYAWLQTDARTTPPGDTATPTPPSAPTPPAPPAIRFVPVAGAPQLGPDDALVTIVEFGDFQCPFTRRVQDTLREIVARYNADVRVVFRHYPLPFHPDAALAAEASMEAFAQRGNAGFGQMHNLLFENQQALSRADLETYATRMRLQVPRFRRALDQRTHQARISEDVALGERLGPLGTPTFFINGEQLVGAQPIEAFVAVIERQRAAARAALAAGIPRSRLYEHLTRAATP